MLLVYRDVIRNVRTRDGFATMRRRIEAGDPVGALIIAGQIEQGVLDAVDKQADDWTKLHADLRAMVLAAAALAHLHASPRQLFAACDAIAAALPPLLQCRSPEGYCHYALDPLAYTRAARRYAADGRQCALVVGVRSIGTSLSAVVAHVLNAPSITIRPRGESGARTIAATDRLRRFAQERLSRGGDVAIVDEGPGATGETFEIVARWCRELGFSDNRIVLFPSHDGSSPLASPSRREWLAGAIRYAPPPEERARLAAEAAGFDCIVPIGAGAWRDHVTADVRLPAVCNFERAKYLARRNGRWYHVRFAGAGEWGCEILRRTSRLAEVGCASPAKPLRHGFIAQPWIDGSPLSRKSLRPVDAAHAANHLRLRHRLFPTGEPVELGLFIRVLTEHGREADMPDAAIAAAVRNIEALPEREAFICDARLAPHEWIRTGSGLWKVDAVDHGDTFRLPGPSDAMWDYAGWIVEFAVPPAQLRQVVTDLTTEDEAAARAYAPAYAALAFGDALLSAREAAQQADRRLLLREARYYRAAMRRLLADHHRI